MTEASQRADWLTLWRSGALPRLCFISLGIAFHAGAENMVTTIMPRIVEDIGGVQFNGWMFAVYEIGAILSGAAAGRLCTYFTVRSNMIAAALLFALGAVATAAAPSMEWALGGRLVCGFGGGALVSLGFVAIQRYFASDIWPQMMAILSVVWGVAALSGPLYGGLAESYFGWRWAFGILAIAALLFAGLCRFVLAGEVAPEKGAGGGRFPAVALLCLAAGITAVAAAGVETRLATSAVLVIVGLIGILAFFRIDATNTADRLFPSALLNPSSPTGVGLIMVGVLAFSTCSFIVYGPLLMAALHGFSPVTTGLVIASESIAWSVLSISVAGMPRSADRQIVRIGAVMIVAGVAGFAWAIPSGAIPLVILFAVLQGGGFGILWPFASRLVVEAAPAHEKEIAASAFSTLQRIGYAVGASVAGIIANLNGFASGFTKETATSAAVPIFAYFVPPALIGCAYAFKLTVAAGRTTAKSPSAPHPPHPP